MFDNQPICAIDVGSTLIKATIRVGVDQVLARCTVPYPPAPAVGQDATHETVWQAFVQAVRGVCANDRPGSIVMSCQMAGLCMLDQRGDPVGELIPGIRVRLPRSPMIELSRSGCGEPAASAVAKLLWFAEEFPEPYAAVTWVGGIKEFLVYRLTGQWVTDRASASSSGFYDLTVRDWSADTLRSTGVSRSQLPRLTEIGETVGAVGRSVADQCGVPAGTTVLCGLGDGPAANISSGAIGRTMMCLSHGTTVVARVLFTGPIPDLASLPVFTQHVSGDWKCVGLRITVDPATGSFRAPGAAGSTLPAEAIGGYLAPLLEAFPISDIRSVGGRPLTLPTGWPVNKVPADAQDGTRAMALIGTGWHLNSAEYPSEKNGLRSYRGEQVQHE